MLSINKKLSKKQYFKVLD